MALNIKDPIAERLAASRRDRKAATDEFLRAFWATLPKGVLGKRISKKERERILGYGPHGV